MIFQMISFYKNTDILYFITNRAMDYDCILELEYNWNNFFEKKKNSCAKRFFKAAIASFISAFKAAWNIKGKLKEKLKYIRYLLFPSLTILKWKN